MRRSAVCVLVLSVMGGSGYAETKIAVKRPAKVDAQFLQGLHPRFDRSRTLSPEVIAALKSGHEASADRSAILRTVPHWSGSFTFQGTAYPYTMVGNAPGKGGITRVPTSVIPISFFFDEFVDPTGKNITIDVGPVLSDALMSPDFVKASYGTGFTQFSDAIQRAEFWNVMGNDWHTIVEAPGRHQRVQVEVPVGLSQLFQLPDGTLFAILDADFFSSQLNTIVQLDNLQHDEFAIALTNNVFLYTGGNPSNCCVLGFHTAFETKRVEEVHYVQTFAWASFFSAGIFSGGFADVTAISHELAEWMNDPFINNATPPWQFPDGSGACQANLETGDPVEVLPNATFPVTLHGFTYNPQTEALLQWFTRESPSSAFNGAYSYPDMTALPGPSVACP
jgi:hypothetical protein